MDICRQCFREKASDIGFYKVCFPLQMGHGLEERNAWINHDTKFSTDKSLSNLLPS
jgi:hypothetical protein